MVDEGTTFYKPSSPMASFPLNFPISPVPVPSHFLQSRAAGPTSLRSRWFPDTPSGRKAPRSALTIPASSLASPSSWPPTALHDSLPRQAWPFPSLSHSICLKNFLQLVITACFLLQESSACPLIISGRPLQP